MLFPTGCLPDLLRLLQALQAFGITLLLHQNFAELIQHPGPIGGRVGHFLQQFQGFAQPRLGLLVLGLSGVQQGQVGVVLGGFARLVAYAVGVQTQNALVKRLGQRELAVEAI